jgi:hypothetical protein
MKDIENALRWVVSVLEATNTPFQISGGFAARLYGSTRELADIDIDIPDEGFDKILPDVSPYVVFGPEQYVDEHWNLKLMILTYRGQVIDVAGEARIFDQNKQEWAVQKTNFADSNPCTIYGVTIPVIKKEALIVYKSKLLREVDREDIEFLTS